MKRNLINAHSNFSQLLLRLLFHSKVDVNFDARPTSAQDTAVGSLQHLLNYKIAFVVVTIVSFNRLSPNSDQHQISPCHILNAYSTPEVVRIKDTISQGEFLDILITSPQYFDKKMTLTR